MSKTHQTIPTVSPKERALLVSVNENTFASLGGVLPPVNTLYSSNEFRTMFGKDYLKNFSGFRYVEQRGNTKGFNPEEGEAGTLLFVRSKTSAEIATPFLDYTEERDHEWSPVLTWISFNQEYGFPMSQNYIIGPGQQGIATVPRWLVQYGWIDGMTLKTKVRVRQFLSDIPYPEWAAESDEPKPTTVNWDLIGNHGNLGKCLHPEVKLPGQGSNAGIRVASLTGDTFHSGNSSQQGQLFYATNHKTWQDYTVNTISRVEGQYLRIEETFQAPLIPKASVINS